MSRISASIVSRAGTKIKAMDIHQKELMLDEIYHNQPNILGLVLIQQRLRVSLQKMDFLLSLFLVCYQAMKDSGLAWPVITEEDIKQQMDHLIASVHFDKDLNNTLQGLPLQQYVENFPEKPLLAFIQAETEIWLAETTPEESDKNIIIAAMSLVNCIAFATTKEQKG
jgi:O-glycosyl hydrolase